MTVVHHLDDATLLRYASGDLDEAFSVVVACHLAICGTCRHAAQAAEEVGGQLMETCADDDLAGDAFDRLMDRIDNGEDRIAADAVTPPTPAADASDAVPLPLRRFVGPSLDAVHWRMVAPGIRKHAIRLPASSRSSLYLLHIAPGKAVPEHGHGGAELTLILSGAYRDELGRFGPGDIADLDEHIEHRPRVEPGAPCICLAATEEPTRFRGFFSRLLQPLDGV